MHLDMVANTSRVTPRQQPGSQRTANGSRCIVIRKSDSLLGHRVNPRCFDFGRAIASEVVVALVVDEDEDDVRWGIGCDQRPADAETQHQRWQRHTKKLKVDELSQFNLCWGGYQRCSSLRELVHREFCQSAGCWLRVP